MLFSSILQVFEILTAPLFFFFQLESPLYGSLAFRLESVLVETSNI